MSCLLVLARSQASKTSPMKKHSSSQRYPRISKESWSNRSPACSGCTSFFWLCTQIFASMQIMSKQLNIDIAWGLFWTFVCILLALCNLNLLTMSRTGVILLLSLILRMWTNVRSVLQSWSKHGTEFLAIINIRLKKKVWTRFRSQLCLVTFLFVWVHIYVTDNLAISPWPICSWGQETQAWQAWKSRCSGCRHGTKNCGRSGRSEDWNHASSCHSKPTSVCQPWIMEHDADPCGMVQGLQAQLLEWPSPRAQGSLAAQ